MSVAVVSKQKAVHPLREALRALADQADVEQALVDQDAAIASLKRELAEARQDFDRATRMPGFPAAACNPYLTPLRGWERTPSSRLRAM
jgi:hypothetical protein